MAYLWALFVLVKISPIKSKIKIGGSKMEILIYNNQKIKGKM